MSEDKDRRGFLRTISTRFGKRQGSGEAGTAEKNRPGEAEIREWLLGKLSSRLGINVDELDVDEPVANYGLDSRTAIRIAGELEDWLEVSLSPTLVWDYPTIGALASYLASDVAGEAPESAVTTD